MHTTFWKNSLPPLPTKPNSRKNASRPEKPDNSKPILPQGKIDRKKPIAKVGKRTKERIAKHGTESELFARIWAVASPFCEICGDRIPLVESDGIMFPAPECFSHRLGKGRYPSLRYEPKNITIVCGMECHAENDRRNAGKDVEIIKEIIG